SVLVSLGSLSAIAQGYFPLHFPRNGKSSKTGCSRQLDGRIDAGIIDPRNGRPPKGKGGNLTIETRTLSLRNGAEVFAQTTGEGDAGKIFIRANESVNVTGISTGSLERQRTSKITASASETSTGNGGSLTIETPLLNVAEGGFISSSSDGKGIAGDINISGDITRLNNGKIIAQTASTDGGDINFNLSQYLLLRNGSQISTTAGTAQAGGNGGNITINTPFIVAAPNENSDITANAFSGAGGNINIFTQNIFGINSRLKPSPQTNDITASSELGVQGQIEIQQPEVQPTQELIQLPNEFIDASTKFSQICPTDPQPETFR
ncbi:S-layer family protein, partial [Calothrix membranacea FACHB-236]|nr:S-layer family protein [Calothrix membranacea FACHB-236]